MGDVATLHTVPAVPSTLFEYTGPDRSIKAVHANFSLCFLPLISEEMDETLKYLKGVPAEVHVWHYTVLFSSSHVNPK